VAGRWFSPVSCTNKTDRHDIAEILLKMALNTITLAQTLQSTVLTLKRKSLIYGISKTNIFGCFPVGFEI
jgi:hypothetical protein